MAAAPRLRSIGTLLSGTAVATLLGLAVQPLLTRLYAPEAWGVADLFVALVTLVAPAASLRYEDTIVLPDGEADAGALVWLSAGLTLATCGGLLLLLPLAAPLLTGSYVPLAPYLWGVAPCLLALRLFVILENVATRRERFGAMAQAAVVRSGVTAAARIGGGLALPTAGVLAAAFGAGYAAALAPLARTLGGELLRPPGWDALRRLARRYRRFPLFATPAILLSSATARLPLLLVGGFALASDVGQLGRAFFAVGAPASLVAAAIGRVFLAEAAQHARAAPHRLAQTGADYAARMVWSVAGPMAVVVALGPDLFGLVFGDEWRAAGVYAQRLGPWLGAAAVASALSGLFDVTGRQRTDALFAVVHVTGIAAGLLVGARLGADPVAGAVAGLGAAGLALRLVHLALLRRAAGGEASWLRACWVPVGLAAAASALALAAEPLGAAAQVGVLAAGALVYAGAAWRAVGPARGRE